MTEIKCDRCGEDISPEFFGDDGHCDACGQDLCAECGGKWGDYGECEMCYNEHEKEALR